MLTIGNDWFYITLLHELIRLGLADDRIQLFKNIPVYDDLSVRFLHTFYHLEKFGKRPFRQSNLLAMVANSNLQLHKAIYGNDLDQIQIVRESPWNELKTII